MAQELDHSVHQRFSSRWGFILSALGIAVGTGNIWRFPRIAAQSGGDEGAGVFLLTWLVFLFAWSIPLIIAEYALGRKYRAGVVGIFMKALGKGKGWLGGFVAFVSTGIAFFYAVIVGWCIYYAWQSLVNPLPDSTEAAIEVWEGFQHSITPFLFHLLAIVFATLAIWKGVSSIERVNRFLIPTLLVIVLIAVVRALTLPGSFEGLRYLFTPQWAQLGDPQVWLAALTQNAWDTGAGWGLFLTYAAYMQVKHGAVKNAFATGIGNNTVSLLSAIMIFGTVFSVLRMEMGMDNSGILGVMRTSGPASTGLTFIWMPQLFEKMFMGRLLAILFFAGLTFAGFSSLIAMFELPTRVLLDTGMKRSSAILTVVGIIYLLGIPSARSLDFLSNQDFVWGIALMISGAIIAFAIVRCGAENMRAGLNSLASDWNLGRWWILEMRFFIPIAVIALLSWWFFLSATEFAPGAWFNPFNAFSVMTCVAQWTFILGLLIGLNRWITGKMRV